MPLADAGFSDEDGRGREHLLALGPTLSVSVSHFEQDPETGTRLTEVVNALVDTGATQSCIDSRLAERLGLPVIDAMEVAGVGGTRTHNVYLASVSIPSLGLSQYGEFAGVELQDGGQPHAALLGRSFLQNVILIYDGLRGQVTLAAPAQMPGQ